jgi:hypothetical protein
MTNQDQPEPNAGKAPAVEHVSRARELLINLQEKVGKHPELAAAIDKLESALNILTVRTGGLL